MNAPYTLMTANAIADKLTELSADVAAVSASIPTQIANVTLHKLLQMQMIQLV